MARVNVTIIGLNRISVSLGLALKQLSKAPKAEHEFIITGSDESREVMKTAHDLGALDQEVYDPVSAVSEANIVLIASPYGLVKDVLSIIGAEMNPGTVVIDLSPLKVPSIQWGKQYFRKDGSGQSEVYLVGMTPLVNPAYLHDARYSVDAAQADLFENGTFIISPAPDCPQEAVQLVAELAALLTIPVHFTDPIEHDGMAAAMEGLPVLVQIALFHSLSGAAGWGDLQRLGNLAFALSAYRLNIDSAYDVAALTVNNRENALRTLERFTASLKELTDLLRTADEETFVAGTADTMDKYRHWLVARNKNKWQTEQETPKTRSINLLGPLGLGFLTNRGKSQNDKSR